MSIRSWFKRVLGRGATPLPAPVAPQRSQEQPTLHPMVARVSEILRGRYSNPDLPVLAEALAESLRGAGIPRQLGGRERVAPFVTAIRHCVPICSDDGLRKRLDDLAGLVERSASHGDVDGLDVLTRGAEAVDLWHETEERGTKASAMLRQAADGGDVPPEIGAAFDRAGRDTRATLSVAEAFAVLAYVSSVPAVWAVPDSTALDRLFKIAGQNAAHQVLSVDKAMGLTLLSDLIAVCHDTQTRVGIEA